jgi:hypothetical protein
MKNHALKDPRCTGVAVNGGMVSTSKTREINRKGVNMNRKLKIGIVGLLLLSIMIPVVMSSATQAAANATNFTSQINITKTPSQTQVISGTNVTYTYVVTNTGNVTMEVVDVNDNILGPIGTVTILDPGKNATFTKTATITSNTTNVATAKGIDFIENEVTATASATVTIIPTPQVQEGRMTGGGKLQKDNLEVTHGFELYCNISQKPNNLEVNWQGNKFHLDMLTRTVCLNDPAISSNPPVAPFDTYKGMGIGSYNGIDGAMAEWVFTDAGEPGTKDVASINIWDVHGNPVLSIRSKLIKGNQQAHAN